MDNILGMDLLGIAAIPVITVICYGMAEVLKPTPLDNKWLPVICIILGAALGVVALYTSPELIPATDILSAIAIGIVSGGFATTINQTYRQLKAKGEEDESYTGKHETGGAE